MKKLLLISSMFLASCTYVAILGVQSSDAFQSNGYYTYASDSVSIIYNFWYDQGMMSFKIINHLDKPLYIDWGTSGLIRNGNTTHYWYDVTSISSTTKSVGVARYNNTAAVGVGRSQTNTTVVKQNRIDIIPPNSFVTEQITGLLPTEINFPNEKTTYTSGTTPFRFRNYIALSEDADCKNSFYVDNNFYISSSELVSSQDFYNTNKSASYQAAYKFYFSNVVVNSKPTRDMSNVLN